MTDPAELQEFLVDSARYGDTEDVRAALDHGAPVNGADEEGRTGGRRLEERRLPAGRPPPSHALCPLTHQVELNTVKTLCMCCRALLAVSKHTTAHH